MTPFTSRIAWSATVSASVTMVWITLLTIVGELYKVTNASGAVVNPLKDLLKALHGHHWVGKGVWAIICFMLVWGFLLIAVRMQSYNVPRAVRVCTYTLICMTMVLYGFFTYEFMIHH